MPNLQAPPLSFAAEEAEGGSDAILLGYPEGGDLAAIPARIREVIQLDGPDLYRTTTVSRQVYTIRGGAKGASGGNVLSTATAMCWGCLSARRSDDPDTGVVLTANEIEPQLADLTSTAPVATGRERC